MAQRGGRDQSDQQPENGKHHQQFEERKASLAAAPDELRLVLGMTPDLYARLAPRISIYSGATQGIVTIDARATDVRGGSFARHAVVRLSGPDEYSLLSWDHQ